MIACGSLDMALAYFLGVGTTAVIIFGGMWRSR